MELVGLAQSMSENQVERINTDEELEQFIDQVNREPT